MNQSFVDVNRRAWDRLARSGSSYSSPYPRHDPEFARHILDPHGWLPWNRLTSVLCLASAGGQQGPLFATLGLAVTVADLSPEQLDRDRAEADRLRVEIECVEADMGDLSMLSGRHFDLVFQPVSAIYVPDVRPVYQQVSQVLRQGGLYQVTHWNPVQMQLADDKPWDGSAYRVTRRQERGVPIRWSARIDDEDPTWNTCLHYIHPLEDLLGGLCDAGFVISRYSEYSPSVPQPAPATIEHLGRYLPTVLTILARRRRRPPW